jgi:hypothetical protein
MVRKEGMDSAKLEIMRGIKAPAQKKIRVGSGDLWIRFRMRCNGIKGLIPTKCLVTFGETLEIVPDPMDKSVGSQRFSYYSVACIYHDERLSVDASQKTVLGHCLIVVTMLKGVQKVLSHGFYPFVRYVYH